MNLLKLLSGLVVLGLLSYAWLHLRASYLELTGAAREATATVRIVEGDPPPGARRAARIFAGVEAYGSWDSVSFDPLFTDLRERVDVEAHGIEDDLDLLGHLYTWDPPPFSWFSIGENSDNALLASLVSLMVPVTPEGKIHRFATGHGEYLVAPLAKETECYEVHRLEGGSLSAGFVGERLGDRPTATGPGGEEEP